MASISVTGHITRLFYENKGVEITEFYKTRDGEQAKRAYTAWFEQPVSFSVGDEGTISGLLSTTIEKWIDENGQPKLNRNGEPGQSIKISINGAHFKAGEATQARAAVAAAVAAMPIDEMPF